VEGCGVEGCGEGGCGAGLFLAGAGWEGPSGGGVSRSGTEGFTRLGTGGGGVLLATLGRLTSDETSEWEEPEWREVELMEREGLGDCEREDTLEGTSGSAERNGKTDSDRGEGGEGGVIRLHSPFNLKLPKNSMVLTAYTIAAGNMRLVM